MDCLLQFGWHRLGDTHKDEHSRMHMGAGMAAIVINNNHRKNSYRRAKSLTPARIVTPAPDELVNSGDASQSTASD
jgi:hypothetical protein